MDRQDGAAPCIQVLRDYSFTGGKTLVVFALAIFDNYLKHAEGVDGGFFHPRHGYNIMPFFTT